MARKKIGLALSGGGARGFAHIGVLRVLAENNIPIDMIAGTSAGSIIGGAYASGMSVDEIEAMAAKVGWLNIIRPAFSFGGVLSNAPMGTFLRKHFPVSRFEDLKIPFAAVAFDLATSEPVIFRDSGDLIEAIRASCSVPGIFAPVRDETHRRLVDGGVVSPMPVETARSMGADIVIAVNLLSCGTSFSNNSHNLIGIALQSTLEVIRAVSIRENSHADLVIEPQIAHLRLDEIKKYREFITLGAEAASEKIGEISTLTEE